MAMIRNLIKEKQQVKDKKEEDEKEKKEPAVVQSIKSATDLQRFKLEKLMKNPNKPMEIPQGRKDTDYMKTVPDFVRNVMGSSAGAGSGEFHVYRHLRRKEYSRQKYIESKSIREKMDEDFQKKLDDNRRLAEERTAKKRLKRQKKKSKKPRPNNDKTSQKEETNDDQNSNHDDDDDDASSENEVVEKINITKKEDSSQQETTTNEEQNTPNENETKDKNEVVISSE